MKKLILLLMFFSAPLMAEPIELTCDWLGRDMPVTIDLEKNTVKMYLSLSVMVSSEIYYSDEDFIVWINNSLKHTNPSLKPSFQTYVLERKTGMLTGWGFQPDEGNPPFEYQCIKPF